jgi:hypothetical protein
MLIVERRANTSSSDNYGYSAELITRIHIFDNE